MDAFNTSAFVGCKAISTINCAEGSIYSMKDNVLMKNGTEIVFALPTVQVTGELVIPEGVTAIGDYAYEKQTGITSVKFPSTLKTIGESAFSGCTGLTGEVVFPEGVTAIGREAFHNCAGVTGVQFPSTLTTIGQQAFDSTGLTALELPASVTSIDYGAFQKTKIKTLNLPDGLNITESSVFQECTELTEISVGGDVMGNGAFGNCTALTTVTVREGATSIGQHGVRRLHGADHREPAQEPDHSGRSGVLWLHGAEEHQLRRGQHLPLFPGAASSTAAIPFCSC